MSDKPSSAGVCWECDKYVEKRYGGEGRYPAVCLACWLAGARLDAAGVSRDATKESA